MPKEPKKSVYRISDHRYSREFELSPDYALLTDQEGQRVCALPRRIAERLILDQELQAAIDECGEEPEAEALPADVQRDAWKAPPRYRSSNTVEFHTEMPWHSLARHPDLEYRVWDEARMRAQVEQFNAGEGVRGQRSEQASRLKDLVARGPWRKLGAPDPAALESLREASGSFSGAFDLIDCARARSPTVPLPPLLLVGPPGMGKTYFAQRLAEVLGAPCCSRDMASLQSNAAFLGSEKHWSDSNPGLLFELLVSGTHANPTVVLDEVEKTSRNPAHDPMNSLHALLEPETARRLTDLSTDVEFDASRIRWILCANTIKPLPAAILSRLHVISMKKPEARERLATTKSVIQSVMQSLAPDFEPVPRDIVVHLATQSPRAVRMCLTTAIGRARLAGRGRLIDDDLAWYRTAPSAVH